jgi:hypothetical protein
MGSVAHEYRRMRSVPMILAKSVGPFLFKVRSTQLYWECWALFPPVSVTLLIPRMLLSPGRRHLTAAVIAGSGPQHQLLGRGCGRDERRFAKVTAQPEPVVADLQGTGRKSAEYLRIVAILVRRPHQTEFRGGSACHFNNEEMRAEAIAALAKSSQNLRPSAGRR